MDLNVLDLDAPETYAGIFEKILYADDVWPILDRYFKDGHGKIDELFCDPVTIKDPLLRKLQHDYEELFCKKYSYVVGYHACRTTDPEQYRRTGLLIASRERLEARAREIFAGKEGLEGAIINAGSYFDGYDGQIHMYNSAKFAGIEYLESGSFYLRRVAAEIGGEERLERQGRPFFVKCRIPLSWLRDKTPFGEHNFLPSYVAALMRRCVWAKASPDEEFEDWPGTLAVLKPVPPENVLKILDADICINWKRRSGD